MSAKTGTNAVQVPSEPQQRCLKRWKCAITRGNSEHELRRFGNAILIYQQALDVARHDFADTARLSIDEAIARVVIAHFNLADCYIALEETGRAADLYLDAQNFLLNLRPPAHLDQHEFCQALMHAASHGNFLWMEFVKKYRKQLHQHQLLRYQNGCRQLAGRQLLFREVVH